jgi:oligopeptide transport system ATP-binding protein
MLKVENLKVYYPSTQRLFAPRRFVRAVDGVSFELGNARTLGLVGESGCGKTTLGRAILGLSPVTEGSIFFEGQDIASLSRSELRKHRRKIQMIFQDPYSSLDPLMTIEQILGEPLDIHRLYSNSTERREKILSLMDWVGLDPSQAKRYPHEFSGGQRQRIGIARALALSPRMIVCDEPVSALDVSIQAQIMNLLMDIQEREKISYLFISHDLALVQHACHRVAVMYLGRIVEEGSVEEIRSRPLHPYTQALWNAIPTLEKETLSGSLPLTGEIPSALNPPAGCHFHPRCPHAGEQCRRVYPTLSEFSSGHCVACHLHSPSEKPIPHENRTANIN